ncbi:hypothetical protein [Vibrio cholerae]|uniref:hypothetical protein n=1 Tax=Vibrio cholerae TaxID=666 RepID=UPI0029C5C74C|nr:hypothetical protein [Vibrio cholerae]EII3727616.1 hypothetical protein [Vibrio cholerae]MDX5049640.1 hypothetical protein [Vibrio cholerae]
MLKIIRLFCLVMPFFISFALYAASSGERKITSLGCHNIDNICFVQIDGAPVGPPACKSNSVRWDIEKDPNGKSSFSLLNAAYFSGKSVVLQISEQCFKYQNNFPTFLWLTVVN